VSEGAFGTKWVRPPLARTPQGVVALGQRVGGTLIDPGVITLRVQPGCVVAECDALWLADWWGLGMLTYEMLTGFPPWYSRDRKKLIRRLKFAPLKIPSTFSPALTAFCEEILNRNISKRLGTHHTSGDASLWRMTVAEVLRAWRRAGTVGDSSAIKAHPFFHGVNWSDLLHRRDSPPIQPCENMGKDSL
jgi:serine/threonine protein kinase